MIDHEWLKGLPKAELHVHHVGSASIDIVQELATRHPGVVPSDREALTEFYTFRDFAHFIEVYGAVVSLIRTPEDIWLLTHEVAREMAQGQGIRYAELTCTPYTSQLAGIPVQAYVEALEDARKAAERDFGITLRWIYDIPGELGIPAAEGTLAAAVDHQVDALIGFGLGGPEIGVPRPQFAPYFAQARAVGLRSVPHAGETTGPETMWDAINWLGAERLGHGIAAAQDPELMAYLVDHHIPLEVCPGSNVATRAVADLESHPLRTLVEAGVPVSINSDDPPMFGTTLVDEYAKAASLLDLDHAGVKALAISAVDASFASEELQASLRAEIDAYEGPTA